MLVMVSTSEPSPQSMVKLYVPEVSKGRVMDSLSAVVLHTEIKGPLGTVLVGVATLVLLLVGVTTSVSLVGGVVGGVVGPPVEVEQDEVKNQVIAVS